MKRLAPWFKRLPTRILEPCPQGKVKPWRRLSTRVAFSARYGICTGPVQPRDIRAHTQAATNRGLPGNPRSVAPEAVV